MFGSDSTHHSYEIENKNAHEKADYVKGHAYSYDRLKELENVPFYNVNSFNFESLDYSKDTVKGDLINTAKENTALYNKVTGHEGSKNITNSSLWEIIVSSSGLRYMGKRISAQIAELYKNLLIVLANAVVINETEGERGTKQGYVLAGVFETKNGGIGVARFFVNEYEGSNNLNGVHLSLYASRSKALKREGVAYNTTQGSSDNADALKPSLSPSVVQLLDLVKETYPNELSQNVLDYFEILEKIQC